jgi:exopolyphosphatase/guanosine-5'-triphosphate,3'-diphosphate pyrophosphatase
VIEHIKKESGLQIEIIDGKLEAQLVFSNHIEEMLNQKHAYMYIDVGGGSTELTLYHNQKVIASKSFNIGTVRMLLNKVESDEWDYMKGWIKKTTLGIHPIHAIGSGGNINKIYKMTKKENNNISYSKLKGIYEMLNSYTYNERVEVLGLKPDRADVIVHAAKIFITIMKTADMETIFVPQIGLSDGIVHDLYEKYNRK